MKGISTRWHQVTVGDICEFKYRKSLPAQLREGGEVEVYGSNGVVGHHIEALTASDTIIIGRKGSYGEVNYASYPCWPIDTTFFVDRTCTKQDLRWLYYQLGALGLNKMNRAAAIPGLSRDDAYRQTFMLPPLPEQRRIADILDKADALRAKRREALALLDQMAQSIFIEMFGDPISNQANYTIRPLQELIEPERPISYGILMPGPHVDDGVKYVRVVDMKEGTIDHLSVRRTAPEISKHYRRSLLRSGDLLLSIRGHVGRLAIVPEHLNGANITQDTARLAVVGASTTFVRECLRHSSFQYWMAKHTKGVAVRGINLGDVKLMPIPIPPKSQQNEFEFKMERTEVLGPKYRQAIADAELLFASLQHRAFRGEL